MQSKSINLPLIKEYINDLLEVLSDEQRVTLFTNDKEFKNRTQMSMLFSNDENRYPVKIWLTMKYGSLVLELNKITN